MIRRKRHRDRRACADQHWIRLTALATSLENRAGELTLIDIATVKDA